MIGSKGTGFPIQEADVPFLLSNGGSDPGPPLFCTLSGLTSPSALRHTNAMGEPAQAQRALRDVHGEARRLLEALALPAPALIPGQLELFDREPTDVGKGRTDEQVGSTQLRGVPGTAASRPEGLPVLPRSGRRRPQPGSGAVAHVAARAPRAARLPQPEVTP